jgi:hypothetical protein
LAERSSSDPPRRRKEHAMMFAFALALVGAAVVSMFELAAFR